MIILLTSINAMSVAALLCSAFFRGQRQDEVQAVKQAAEQRKKEAVTGGRPMGGGSLRNVAYLT